MTTDEPYAEGLASFLAACGVGMPIHLEFFERSISSWSIGCLCSIDNPFVQPGSRFKIIKWGATHLLESVLRKNRRQIQLRVHWIILIIRCAIPILRI